MSKQGLCSQNNLGVTQAHMGENAMESVKLSALTDISNVFTPWHHLLLSHHSDITVNNSSCLLSQHLLWIMQIVLWMALWILWKIFFLFPHKEEIYTVSSSQ